MTKQTKVIGITRLLKDLAPENLKDILQLTHQARHNKLKDIAKIGINFGYLRFSDTGLLLTHDEAEKVIEDSFRRVAQRIVKRYQ